MSGGAAAEEEAAERPKLPRKIEEEDEFAERPSVLDPTTGFKLETNNADFEGWIVKQSTWRKEWRRRYMLLKGTTLFFSKDESSVPHQVSVLDDVLGE